MPIDPKLLAALDSLQAGQRESDDPRLAEALAQLKKDPAVAEVFHRIQHADDAIRDAFREVPVPSGLQQRLLAALAENETTEADVADAVTTLSITDASVPRSGKQSHRLREAWIRRAAVAMAAACLITAILFVPRRTEYDLELVMANARDLYTTELKTQTVDLTRESQPLPAGFEASRFIVTSQQPDRPWHRVKGFLDRDGVAIDLSEAGGVRATLYVVKLGAYQGAASLRKILGSQPPGRPLTTENRTTAAWREDNLVFVLVVDGDSSAYQRLVRPLGPVA